MMMIAVKETKMKKREDLREDLPVDASAEQRCNLTLAAKQSSCRQSPCAVYLSSPVFAQGRDFFVEVLRFPDKRGHLQSDEVSTCRSREAACDLAIRGNEEVAVDCGHHTVSIPTLAKFKKTQTSRSAQGIHHGHW